MVNGQAWYIFLKKNSKSKNWSFLGDLRRFEGF
jgi:hypothetical protein